MLHKLLSIFFLLGITSVLAQNVSVEDYDVPISTAKILRFTGTYNWAQSSNDSVVFVTANNATANLVFSTFYSSLPFAWFLDVNATGGKNFDQYNHDVTIAPSIRKYLWDDKNWFGFASAFVEHANTYKQIASDVTLGGGYGRYINATALAKAVRIEEHLIRESVISGNLPKETMIKIANIIEREDEYRGIYGDTYEKDWYEAIEKEIKASGLLNGESLGAIGILRTQQVLKGINEIVRDRYYGWDLTLGVLFNLSTWDKSDTRSPALSFGGRFSHPIAWRSQINAFANINSPLDSTFFKFYFLNAGLDYVYELSNKINFLASYRMNLTQPSVGDSFIDHNLLGSFVFYLENSINLGINAGVVRSGISKTTDLFTSVSVQYNLF
ncbi:MAG TPA: hypothetical protein PKA80_12815 [Ignavibacteriaceae bacterium]|nr:hypothetical protein [Ignavibacteriaceae bacterium]